LSVPDELKAQMSHVDWINWSSVARRAFTEKLRDVRELEIQRKVSVVSEIPYGDHRQVRADVADEVVKSVNRTLRQGKKPMTQGRLNSLLGLK